MECDKMIEVDKTFTSDFKFFAHLCAYIRFNPLS